MRSQERIPSRAPSDRIWQWLQSLSRTASASPDGVIRVTPRQVYILPTKYGLTYAAMLLAMLFGSNNYGSNPGFMITFLLAGLGMAALFQTWNNLVGLEIRIRSGEPVFRGTPAEWMFTISNPSLTARGKIEAGIYITHRGGWFGSNKTEVVPADASDIHAGSQQTLTVSRPTTHRGNLKLGRTTVSTTFPLGLFKAWTYLSPDSLVVVYPEPAAEADGIDRNHQNKGTHSQRSEENDDFDGHKVYQDGDNIMHVDWKVNARGMGLHLKNFAGQQSDEVWLRWNSTMAADPELRISRLTRAILDMYAEGVAYGFELGETRMATDYSHTHRNKCLEALATFGLEHDDG